MKTILVTGSNGLLGQKLTDLYRHQDQIQLVATGRGADRYPEKSGYVYLELDITDPVAVEKAFQEVRPDCVIHTAAMTNVDACELDHKECLKQNVEAVRVVAEAAEKAGSHLIHLSTDFILDGTSGPYREDVVPNPLSFYGHSKLKAEEIVKSAVTKWAIVRTVLVYGLVADMSRSNIVLWAKESLAKQTKIRVVDDQFRTPTLAEDLARGCQLIEAKEATGIFNISGKDYMSIYELIGRVATYYGYSMENVERVSSHTLNQPAKRPPVTGFIITKAREILGYEPHSFEEGIAIVDKQSAEFTKALSNEK